MWFNDINSSFLINFTMQDIQWNIAIEMSKIMLILKLHIAFVKSNIRNDK